MENAHDLNSVLAHRKFVEASAELENLDLAERFSRIKEMNLWGADYSVSGVGSVSEATSSVREALPPVLASLGVRSLLDAPCGDANWIRTALKLDTYIGVDIVPSLIEPLQRDAAQNETFLVRDITTDELPTADAILCRDCLVHLSFENIERAILLFEATGARWFEVVPVFWTGC